MEGVLKSLEGKAAKYTVADKSFTGTITNDATTEQPKVMVSEIAEIAKVKEARQCKSDATLPAVNNSNSEINSSAEAAEGPGTTSQTLRQRIEVGRPIAGRERKDLLKVKTICGRYVFEAASVRALSKKLASWS